MSDKRETFENSWNILITVLLILMGIVVLRNAWICDDAFISFRTVDNFVNGYGLTWNTDERVQGFTNPLWVLVISASYLLTSELYYTSIALSLILSLLAVGLIAFRISRTPGASVLAVVILLFSKAFIDYSTSGLENPLTFLIITLFALVYFGAYRNSKQRLFDLAVVASLGALNRPDTILLYLPALAWMI